MSKDTNDVFDLAVANGWTEDELVESLFECIREHFEQLLASNDGPGAPSSALLTFYNTDAGYKLVITAHKEPLHFLSDAIH